jgi:hypothetical protein
MSPAQPRSAASFASATYTTPNEVAKIVCDAIQDWKEAADGPAAQI